MSTTLLLTDVYSEVVFHCANNDDAFQTYSRVLVSRMKFQSNAVNAFRTFFLPL